MTQGDVDDALNRQRSGGGRLEDTLVQSGKISPEMLARSLAMQLGYEFIEEGNTKVDPYAVTLVPEATVRRYNRDADTLRRQRSGRRYERPAARVCARRHQAHHG